MARITLRAYTCLSPFAFTHFSSQLKIDAQSRQVKRQEEDLSTLRDERELQLVRSHLYDSDRRWQLNDHFGESIIGVTHSLNVRRFNCHIAGDLCAFASAFVVRRSYSKHPASI